MYLPQLPCICLKCQVFASAAMYLPQLPCICFRCHETKTEMVCCQFFNLGVNLERTFIVFDGFFEHFVNYYIYIFKPTPLPAFDVMYTHIYIYMLKIEPLEDLQRFSSNLNFEKKKTVSIIILSFSKSNICSAAFQYTLLNTLQKESLFRVDNNS